MGRLLDGGTHNHGKGASAAGFFFFLIGRLYCCSVLHSGIFFIVFFSLHGSCNLFLFSISAFFPVKFFFN